MTKRVIELIRVSTDSQAADDRASIPAQRAVNRRTERAYGLRIVRTIQMADVSGASVLHAPEIKELLKLIESPDIHGVVTKEFSRLMRPENFSDYAMLQAFIDTKTILYLPDGPIDFTNKSGLLLGTIRAVMAGMEISDIRERAWDAKEEKRREGKFPQSSICLPSDVGYDKERGWYYKPEAEKVREAFRLFLSGDTSYFSVGEKVGIDPFTLRVKLRNPIYTGWRVIDQRRDPSPSARKFKPDGRQADRPKIKRAAEDVIRVRVIDEPLVSEQDFFRVQQIMDIKKRRHWRARPDYQHKYTYNGFLTCASCGDLVYTHFRRADYYVCKSRKLRGACGTSYMRRDVVDPQLDRLFSSRLTDPGFLREITEETVRLAEAQPDAYRADRLRSEIESLRAKRERVLDAYFDGAIDQPERDTRLAKIDANMVRADEMLSSVRPSLKMTENTLASLFSPFYEFEYLGRDDKRRLLETIAPDIHVANYKVQGISVMASIERGDEISLRDKDSLQQPT